MKIDEGIHVFGHKLRDLRRKKGFTQTKLSELSGVSRRAIVHYENHAKRPTVDKVIKLAEALGVSDEELLGFSKQEKKKVIEDISYKIMKKFRVIEKLPTRDQNTIFQFINTVVEKNKLKEELKSRKKS